MPISNQQLRDAFLSPQMRCYFERKLPDVPSDDLDARIDETLKFLNMASFCEGNIPVSQEIDDVWHYWILETREYAKLCASLQGRKFIHHASNVFLECGRDGVKAPTNELEQDVAVLGNYVLNYGAFESNRVKYWVLADYLVEKGGMTVDMLNEWLISGVPA